MYAIKIFEMKKITTEEKLIKGIANILLEKIGKNQNKTEIVIVNIRTLKLGLKKPFCIQK